MKALMVAYACESNKGSEPEVGWRWMCKLAGQYSELVVVTRRNNKKSIESSIHNSELNNVRFVYYDLPELFLRIKNKGRGAFVYAYLWEIFLFFHMLRRYDKDQFDFVQRVTFVSYRLPTLSGYFGKKFCFGPVAGGERFHYDFYRILSIRGKLRAFVRTCAQRIALIDPLVLFTLFKADEIIAVTEDTKTILPNWVQNKVIIKPAISISENDFKVSDFSVSKEQHEELRLLYVGRLLEWKGLKLSLMALTKLDKDFRYVFNVVGSGPDKSIFEDYAKKHCLNVNFLGEVPREQLSEFYNHHDVFLFPSLHDSGGMVVLEAKAHGLPVIVSDFGGPKGFVDDKDIIIKSHNVECFVAELYEKILSF